MLGTIEDPDYVFPGSSSGSMSTGLIETPYYATSMSSHAIYSGTGTITISGCTSTCS